MYKKQNIEEEHIKEQERLFESEINLFLRSVNDVLIDDEIDEVLIIQKLSQNTSDEFELIEVNRNTNEVFTINEIKNICLNFRLKFLKSHYYNKENIPLEAIHKIKHLQHKVDKEFSEFYILTSKKGFGNKFIGHNNMIFAKLNPSNYLLIHKWGKQYSWKRKLFVSPFRNLLTLFSTISVLSVLLYNLMPKGLLQNFLGIDNNLVSILGVFSSIFLIISMLILTFFKAFNTNVSSIIWNKA